MKQSPTKNAYQVNRQIKITRLFAAIAETTKEKGAINLPKKTSETDNKTESERSFSPTTSALYKSLDGVPVGLKHESLPTENETLEDEVQETEELKHLMPQKSIEIGI